MWTLVISIHLNGPIVLNLGPQVECDEVGNKWLDAVAAWEKRSGTETRPMYMCFEPDAPMIWRAKR